MTTVKYREDLDQVQCSGHDGTAPHHIHPDEPVFLHSACHTGAPMTVMYHGGVLEVLCYVCRRVVTRIAVASSPRH